jgi:hypothetical protein
LQLYGDTMVWYNMFILFTMYCMMPVPVKWCTICCLLTALIHLIVVAAVSSADERGDAQHSVRVSTRAVCSTTWMSIP